MNKFSKEFLFGLLLITGAAALAVNLSLFNFFGGLKPDPAEGQNFDPQEIARLLGGQGEQQPGGVFKILLPRNDLNVSIQGAKLNPAAYSSHVEFLGDGKEAMVMGDLVLTQNEVNEVMPNLSENNIDITAIHNHFLGETPRLVQIHIHAAGDPQKIAKNIHDALFYSGIRLNAGPSSQAIGPNSLNTQEINSILGLKGITKDGVYQVSVPRAETITDNGQTIPPAMGVATSIIFQPIDPNTAATTGDLVLLADEVNPVIKALEDAGIYVTALHNHTLTEQPRLFYLHFWGGGKEADLARGLKAALDKTNSLK